MKYILFKTKMIINIWFYIHNLDISALTSSMGLHLQNNQWIHLLIPLDTYCEEVIRQEGYKPIRSIFWPDLFFPLIPNTTVMI